jgi:hypothetical protein
MGIFFLVMPLAQTPGPDLARQDAVMGSEAFVRSAVTTTMYSRSVAPPDPVPVSGRGGQAYDMAPYWVVSKWFIEP